MSKAGEGSVLTAFTSKKHLSVQTKPAGTFVLQITDTAKTGFYICARNPSTGLVSASAQLSAGNYGGRLGKSFIYLHGKQSALLQNVST